MWMLPSLAELYARRGVISVCHDLYDEIIILLLLCKSKQIITL